MTEQGILLPAHSFGIIFQQFIQPMDKRELDQFITMNFKRVTTAIGISNAFDMVVAHRVKDKKGTKKKELNM